MNVAELCAIPTHVGDRWYADGHFGCDSCKGSK